MLDNVELIDTLESTKTKAGEVAEKLKLGAKTAIEIDKMRDGEWRGSMYLARVLKVNDSRIILRKEAFIVRKKNMHLP